MAAIEGRRRLQRGCCVRQLEPGDHDEVHLENGVRTTAREGRTLGIAGFGERRRDYNGGPSELLPRKKHGIKDRHGRAIMMGP